MLLLLQKRQYNIDQLKQCITALKKRVQSMNENTLKSPSIGSDYDDIYNSSLGSDEHKL